MAKRYGAEEARPGCKRASVWDNEAAVKDGAKYMTQPIAYCDELRHAELIAQALNAFENMQIRQKQADEMADSLERLAVLARNWSREG